MFDSPLASLLTSYSIVGLVGLASCLVGASIYDLKEAKISRKIQLHPYSKLSRHKPVISIIIYITKPRQQLLKSLESIRRSSYRNYEIIVVDDTPPQDRENTNVKGQVSGFKATYPKARLQVLQRRKNSGRSAAIAAAIKKWAHGEFIMNLDAGTSLDKHALRNSARHFNFNDEVVLVIPNASVRSNLSIVSVFEQFNQLLVFSTAKLTSLTGLAHASAAAGVIYRRTGNLAAAHLIKYGSDVLIYNPPAESWTSLLRASYHRKLEALRGMSALKNKATPRDRYPLNKYQAVQLAVNISFQLIAIMTPAIIAYLLYLAVYFKQPALYGLSWIIFSVILLSIIWGKDHLAIRSRLSLTTFVPVIYALFFMLNVMQVGLMVVGILKYLFWSRKQLFRRAKLNSPASN